MICLDCACFYSNLDDEIKKEMDESAPGEECTAGFLPDDELKKCPAYQPLND